MRTGNEPVTARSALRLRFWLSVWGLIWCGGAAAVFALVSVPVLAGVCAALALIAVVDLAVIVHRMRQGAHFQPGRDVPPYEPVYGARRQRPPRHLHHHP
ncbi:DUF6343 family protein [Streptomyces sp. NBC_01497]|uniref:DUF6343 family protein n=1 Tax=Streptomyces sp. NBC_01497 TaxID=2903885 RepID=UPI002E371B5B|nr:DUF6343 family protein [Streptomyces sp. NBC_01497]